jgi:hypothetical protein
MAITTRNYRGLTPAVPRRERDCRGGYRKMMTGGLHLSLGRRERAHTLSVLTPGWAEAETLAGPDCFPEALF